jgi:hypothetical protein
MGEEGLTVMVVVGVVVVVVNELRPTESDGYRKPGML